MAKRLFTFVQLELPWELGPPDGRYLLRTASGPASGTPEHVVVLSTLGAARRNLLGGKRTKTRPTSPQPTPVAVARATAIDAVALSAEGQARTWLEQLDPEREMRAATGVLNRLLFAHRIAAASPYVHEVSAAQALVVRAGFGEGEQVADGQWTEARELVPGDGRAPRRAAALRPQERLAALLAGKGQALLCEELVLRARGDVEQGRLSHAAIELERAYEAALAELPSLRRNDLEQRISELRELAPALRDAAAMVLSDARAGASDGAVPDEPTVRHALERLEAALRARSAAGLL